MKLSKFLMCFDKGKETKYVLHTENPRFIATVTVNPDKTIDIIPSEWIDKPIANASLLAKLMREMGDWYAN